MEWGRFSSAPLFERKVYDRNTIDNVRRPLHLMEIIEQIFPVKGFTESI